jgi:hypothetical protein
MKTSSLSAALAAALMATPAAAGIVNQATLRDMRSIQIQSTVKQPLVLRILGPDGRRCGNDITVSFGNRPRIALCGRSGQVALHDGVGLAVTPVYAGRVYEVYSNGDRWALRQASEAK